MDRMNADTPVGSPSTNGTLDIEALADMLQRGEVPGEYETILRNISDADLERLWESFRRARRRDG